MPTTFWAQGGWAKHSKGKAKKGEHSKARTNNSAQLSLKSMVSFSYLSHPFPFLALAAKPDDLPPLPENFQSKRLRVRRSTLMWRRAL